MTECDKIEQRIRGAKSSGSDNRTKVCANCRGWQLDHKTANGLRCGECKKHKEYPTGFIRGVLVQGWAVWPQVTERDTCLEASWKQC